MFYGWCHFWNVWHSLSLLLAILFCFCLADIYVCKVIECSDGYVPVACNWLVVVFCFIVSTMSLAAASYSLFGTIFGIIPLWGNNLTFFVIRYTPVFGMYTQ